MNGARAPAGPPDALSDRRAPWPAQWRFPIHEYCRANRNSRASTAFLLKTQSAAHLVPGYARRNVSPGAEYLPDARAAPADEWSRHSSDKADPAGNDLDGLHPRHRGWWRQSLVHRRAASGSIRPGESRLPATRAVVSPGTPA